MKALVLDTSMAIEWYRADGDLAVVDKRDLMADHQIVVPTIWASEVLNWIAMRVRGGHTSLPEADAAATEMLSWPTMTSEETNPTSIIRLCADHGLTSYDASFLNLAIEGGWPLATLDKALMKAAIAVGVDLV